MVRRIVLMAALLAVAGRWAQAATCGPPTGLGPVLNGFEGTPDTDATCAGEVNDITDWTVSFTPAGGTAALTADNAGFTPAEVEGNYCGYDAWSPTTLSTTLTLAPASFSANKAWDNYNYVFVAYASVSTSAVDYSMQFEFTNGSAVLADFVEPGTGMVATGAWTYVITSLNYARNIGFSTTSISALALANFAVAAHPVGVAYDDLQLDPITGTLDTPNPPVPAGEVGGTAGCDSFSLTWEAQTSTGTDTIVGYHIYRGASATGPWTSVAYVPGIASNSYADGLASGTAVYYIVLPYSSTTTAFGGGATGYFTSCNNSTLDPVHSNSIGVNEAALTSATAAGPFDPQSGCSPTETSTYSPSPSPSATVTLTYTLTPTYTATPTATPSPTVSPSATITSTNVPTDTPVPGATDTPTGGGVGGGSTPTFTDTPTLYVTPTPAFTPTSAVLWPNPFYPDRQQPFHVGPVPAGAAWTVFDLVGKFVYKSGAGEDTWNGYNANGIEVTTGIYFLVLQGHVYRLAVVRN